eukprot:7391448-Prymnesium_polylepis.1
MSFREGTCHIREGACPSGRVHVILGRAHVHVESMSMPCPCHVHAHVHVREGACHAFSMCVSQEGGLEGEVWQRRKEANSQKGGAAGRGVATPQKRPPIRRRAVASERAQSSGSSWGWGGALRSAWQGGRAAGRRGGPGGQLLRGLGLG